MAAVKSTTRRRRRLRLAAAAAGYVAVIAGALVWVARPRAVPPCDEIVDGAGACIVRTKLVLTTSRMPIRERALAWHVTERRAYQLALEPVDDSGSALDSAIIVEDALGLPVAVTVGPRTTTSPLGPGAYRIRVSTPAGGPDQLRLAIEPIGSR